MPEAFVPSSFDPLRECLAPMSACLDSTSNLSCRDETDNGGIHLPGRGTSCDARCCRRRDAEERPTAVERDCAAGLAGEGTDRTAWTSPGRGFVTAQLEAAPAATGSSRPSAMASPSAPQPRWARTSGSTFSPSAGSASYSRPVAPTAGPKAVRLDTSFARFRPKPAEPVSLARVPIAGPEDVAELMRMGTDVTHQVGPDSATVVLYSREERLRLLERGFGVETLVPDLAAADAADRRAEARVAARGTGSELPSGRTEYRQYADYTDDLERPRDRPPRDRARGDDRHDAGGTPDPGHRDRRRRRRDRRRPARLRPTGRSSRARVAVGGAADGVRHRPGGELRHGLADHGAPRRRARRDRPSRQRGRLRRVTERGSRPIDDDQARRLPSPAGSGRYRRKNCRPLRGRRAHPCAARTSGVDLNRNYGAYWGGPGSSTSPTSESYRGPSPYSEPEAQAVREFSSGIHPTVFISNHTFTDRRQVAAPARLRRRVLPSGLDRRDHAGRGSDEGPRRRLWRARRAGTSERGYETLGDITGATEDWNYFAQGSYGYTPEARGTELPRQLRVTRSSRSTSATAQHDGRRGPRGVPDRRRDAPRIATSIRSSRARLPRRPRCASTRSSRRRSIPTRARTPTSTTSSTRRSKSPTAGPTSGT